MGINVVGSCIDSGSRHNCALCLHVTKGVVQLLRAAFPGVGVQLLWNRPILSDFGVLACSDVTVCTPSSFCIFPSLLAGRALLPRSPVFFGGLAGEVSWPKVEWFDVGRGFLSFNTSRRYIKT